MCVLQGVRALMNPAQSKELSYAYQNLRIYGSNDLWMCVHATRFLNSLTIYRELKLTIPVYFFRGKLPAAKIESYIRHVRELVRLLFPPLLLSHALSDKRTPFQDGTDSPVDRGSTAIVYANIMQERRRDCSILLVCYVPRAAYANNSPYANRRRGLNACSQSRVSISSDPLRSFRSRFRNYRDRQLGKCHRSRISIVIRALLRKYVYYRR